MVCAGGPIYFTTYKCAAIHYARSVTCNQSQRCITTVVLRNSPADVDTGGSGPSTGAAGMWLDLDKMQADVAIVLASALQLTEIARSHVSYMTSTYLSQIRFIYDSLFNRD